MEKIGQNLCVEGVNMRGMNLFYTYTGTLTSYISIKNPSYPSYFRGSSRGFFVRLGWRGGLTQEHEAKNPI